MRNYDVVKYWNERNNPCSNSIDELTKDHISFLYKQLSDCKSVLDFGPGYGRLFSSYKEGCKVVGVDVTEQYLEELTRRSKEQKILFSFICKKDILKQFDFDDKYFDAVVASEVLFHQTPMTVELMMKELIRISKKVVVITYMNPKEKYDDLNSLFDSGRYCFNYDYYKILKNNKWKIYNEKRLKNQLMFVYSEV